MSIQIAQDRILSLVDSGDIAAANTAIGKLKVDFANDSRLAEGLCRIAYKFEKVEALEQAKALNSQTAADFRNDDFGMSLQHKIYKNLDYPYYFYFLS